MQLSSYIWLRYNGTQLFNDVHIMYDLVLIVMNCESADTISIHCCDPLQYNTISSGMIKSKQLEKNHQAYEGQCREGGGSLTLMASMAYSTWKSRPSGEKVFTPRSYSDLVRNMLQIQKD